MIPILTVEVRFEHDVVLARQRARQIASLLGFDRQDQVRVATAVSEIARNAYHYARRGKVEFGVESGKPQLFQVRISDSGLGISNLDQILEGTYKSSTGMGLGIIGARRLMDQFQIKSTPAGTTVLLGKHFPPRAPAVNREAIGRLTSELARQAPQDPFEEMQRQNQDLLATLEELQRRTNELAQLNRELEDTNRGVVALYAELDEKADYLRRASELKSRFLSNMTHEFRTPLNSILSLSRMLLDRVDGDLNPEQEKQLAYIEKAATGLSELVNDLLDLAKVEAGKIIVRPGEFAVEPFFGALRGMLRPLLAHNTSVNLVFDEPVDIPLLNTDESKVSQILRNFISNALKYTERGEVRVSAKLEPGGEHVTFSVADTGIGIAPEDQERIFEEFTQVDSQLQRRAKGTGLGLPLSKKLAELLGGHLSLRSEPGVGSTFSVTIPIVYKGPAEVAQVPEVPRETDPTRRPVLVIEDNLETMFIYEKYLKGTGFQVIPARNLREARRELSRIRPFAIVMDILLEHENSWDLLEQLKRSASTRDIPVYVVTMVENRNKALALGADDFHEKPVDRDWLITKLAEELKKQPPEPILIVDDDEVSRYVLKGLLTDTRYRIVEATGGYEGLTLAHELKPAAVFLDIVMPDLNGFEVLDRLKSAPDTRNIPVIAVTSKLLSDQELKRLSNQTVTVLSKEHSSRDVSIAKIRDALVRAGLPHSKKELNHAEQVRGN